MNNSANKHTITLLKNTLKLQNSFSRQLANLQIIYLKVNTLLTIHLGHFTYNVWFQKNPLSPPHRKSLEITGDGGSQKSTL